MKLLADENINNEILRRMQTRHPEFEVIRVQDTVLFHAADPVILEWATENDYVLISHDVNTMINETYQRIAQEIHTTGVLIIREPYSIGAVIADLALIIEANQPEEWANKVTFIPLR
jgi:hypothetical protein